MESDLEMDWEKALKGENCVEVKKLLRKVPQRQEELLRKGWEEVDIQPSGRAWKGRTALHVATRRGDVELVDEIVKIFRDSIAKKENGPDYSSCHLLEVMHVDYKLDALAMAVVNGNGIIVDLLKTASQGCAWNPYDIAEDEFAPYEDRVKSVAAQAGKEEAVPDEEPVCTRGTEDALLSHVINESSHLKETTQMSKEERDLWQFLPNEQYVFHFNTAQLCQENKVLSRITKDAFLIAGDRELMEEKLMKETMSDDVKLSDRTKKLLVSQIDGLSSHLKEITKMYEECCDFNFLPMGLYFFHFTFSKWKPSFDLAIKEEKYLKWLIHKVLQKEIFSQAKAAGTNLLDDLLDLKDGQGRTALHVAVDSEKVMDFWEVIRPRDGEPELDREIVNATDSAGRTPLYRAAAKNLPFAVQNLLDDQRTDVHRQIVYRAHRWGKGLDIDKLSWRNGFNLGDCVYVPDMKLRSKGFTNKTNALHVAIIHKHGSIVKLILEQVLKSNCEGGAPGNCTRRYNWPVLADPQGDTVTDNQLELSTLQLTVLVGSVPILQDLLKAEEKKPDFLNSAVMKMPFPSFLLAAAIGNREIIQMLLNNKARKFDCSTVDGLGNTALHHVLKGQNVQPVQPHLADFVGCSHVYSSRFERLDAPISDWLANLQEGRIGMKNVERDDLELKKRYSARKGCINLLLVAGINIWALNHYGTSATPEPDAPEDFSTWWYDRILQEAKHDQAKLNNAASAISLTAALVATASYVGPFQPPLGYGGDMEMQVNILAIRTFLVCNILSFYFALAAIILALLPWLSLEKTDMLRDMFWVQMRRTYTVVFVAVSLLLSSITFVLLAFAAGYIAVMPNHGMAHQSLTVGTTAVGIFICLVTIIWSLRRVIHLGIGRRIRHLGRRVSVKDVSV